MAQVPGTDDKKAVNIELNIIPFIDLMSCLVAFLLVAVVWIGLARLDVRPTGHARDAPCDGTGCDDVRLSVLLDADQIWIGVSRVNDFERIPRIATGYDWRALEDALHRQKASPWFEHATAIEIAADSTPSHPISYQSLIAAMDVAVKTGFVDVGLTDPQGLSARPVL
ncbi:MAG TPA: biopolymer transporter ExbD [Kofleriaceae bacterium]|jgi:biopolymer transport protein ExbD|nr:biopolymer transporter ExbD [Kofleriaceae bacterium]